MVMIAPSSSAVQDDKVKLPVYKWEEECQLFPLHVFF